MVECGIPIKSIHQRLFQYLLGIDNISACLITHAHKDHSKAAQDINRYGIPIFATKGTLRQINVKGHELLDLKPSRLCEGVYAMPFAVEHDCDGSSGFVIKTPTECVIFVNDHKRWTCNLSNFKPDYVFIECNYDHKVVYAQLHELEKKKDRTEEENLKIKQHKRNLESHCSLHGTIKGLKKLNLTNAKCVFLMHLSDRYANEYRMKNTVQLETGVLTMVCKKEGGIK